METEPPLSGPESERAQFEAQNATLSAAHSATTDIIQTDAFWSDLQAFLSQRLRDEDESKVLIEKFKAASRS